MAGGSANDETTKQDDCSLAGDFLDVFAVCGSTVISTESGARGEAGGESIASGPRGAAGREEAFRTGMFSVPWKRGRWEWQTAHAATGVGYGAGGESRDVVLDFEEWFGKPPDAFVFTFAGGTEVADHPVFAAAMSPMEVAG